MNYQQKERLAILNRIKELFIRADKKGIGIVEDKLTLQLMVETGCSKNKVREYIDLLVDVNYIVRDLGSLWLKDKSYKASEEVDRIIAGDQVNLNDELDKLKG